VCRSCTLVYAAAVTTGFALWWASLPEAVLFPAFYALFIPVMLLSYPRLYERFPRRAKDVVRSATGSVLALMVAFFVSGYYALGLLNVAVFTVGYHVSLVEYRKWKHRACDGCPETGRDTICSGFSSQADKIRAFEAAAEEHLLPDAVWARRGYPLFLAAATSPSVATAMCRGHQMYRSDRPDRDSKSRAVDRTVQDVRIGTCCPKGRPSCPRRRASAADRCTARSTR